MSDTVSLAARGGAFALVLALPGAGMAQQADAAAIFEAMRLDEIVEIMRTEGLSYADEIADSMFQGPATADWSEAVETIYDAERMRTIAMSDFGAAIDSAEADEILAFFSAEPGATIVRLEVEARLAMLDDAVEEASNDVAAMAMMDETERFELISRFVEVNDIIETNVVGALNSNFAFYSGLADGGAMPQDMSQDQLLAIVWAQEDEIRTSTTEWIFSYLLLAYQPLEAADIESYIAFSETPAGQALNRALFAGFDDMFVAISRDLGVAAAQEMSGQAL